MDDISKLSTLLDDLEIRELIFGLAHVKSMAPSTASGAIRLHAVVLYLAETTNPGQYRSWLSDDAPNEAMTVDEVRSAIGDRGWSGRVAPPDQPPGHEVALAVGAADGARLEQAACALAQTSSETPSGFEMVRPPPPGPPLPPPGPPDGGVPLPPGPPLPPPGAPEGIAPPGAPDGAAPPPGPLMVTPFCWRHWKYADMAPPPPPPGPPAAPVGRGGRSARAVVAWSRTRPASPRRPRRAGPQRGAGCGTVRRKGTQILLCSGRGIVPRPPRSGSASVGFVPLSQPPVWCCEASG
jgi:hypothetical protein